MKYLSFFLKGHERTVRAKKNIISSIAFRSLNIGISFMLVPLTIHYLNPINYGIWLTLSSIITWFTFFDIGLGNGLRNKFAEALALNEDDLAKTYVSTVYFILGSLILVIFTIFLIINPFIDWSRILNTGKPMKNELNLLATIVFTSFAIRFVFSLINMILLADQRAGICSFLEFLANLLNLIAVYILIKITTGSLLLLGLIFSLTAAVVPLLAGIWFFNEKYHRYSPSLKYVKFKYAKQLISIGVKFFIIQISLLVIYSTSNLLITQMVGIDQVTVYNIAYKYYSIITMFFLIICTPLWSAYTEAYHKKDFAWIKRIIKTLLQIWVFLTAIVIVMTLVSKLVYGVWIGNTIKISLLISTSMAMFVIVQNWIAIFHYFINGVGKIRLQMYLACFSAIIYIPLAIFFVKYLRLGTSGVILATIACLTGNVIFAPIQTMKILQNKDVGIWSAQ